MEGESDDPEGSQSFDQHSANCELYGCCHGSLWTNSILFLISEVYNFLSTIFDSLLSHPTVVIYFENDFFLIFFLYIFFLCLMRQYLFVSISFLTDVYSTILLINFFLNGPHLSKC